MYEIRLEVCGFSGSIKVQGPQHDQSCDLAGRIGNLRILGFVDFHNCNLKKLMMPERFAQSHWIQNFFFSESVNIRPIRFLKQPNFCKLPEVPEVPENGSSMFFQLISSCSASGVWDMSILDHATNLKLPTERPN